jgi:hypothetical protein
MPGYRPMSGTSSIELPLSATLLLREAPSGH